MFSPGLVASWNFDDFSYPHHAYMAAGRVVCMDRSEMMCSSFRPARAEPRAYGWGLSSRFICSIANYSEGQSTITLGTIDKLEIFLYNLTNGRR